MGLKETVFQEWKNFKRNKIRNKKFTRGKDEKKIVDTIKSEGVCVVEGFISEEKAAELKSEIERILLQYSNKIWVDSERSDHRAWGANLVSELIENEFHKNEFINRIISTHEGQEIESSITLGAKLSFSEKNKGSGGGWHRDRPDRRQTKAILYLTDVAEENGPFQYIAGSNRPLTLIKDQLKHGFSTDQYRFEEHDINKMINDAPSKLITFKAKAGTLIFADTRGIHRGMPLRLGERYALTNYYWVGEPMHSGIKNMLLP